MNVSSRCEYGCRAVLELAGRWELESPMTAETIAERRAMPEKFLVHILLQLKRAGLVRSVRGARGGYLLARAPEEISLLDIVRAIDGPVLKPLPARDSGSEGMASAWGHVARELEKVLNSVTVRSILDAAQNPDMFYI